MQFRAFILFKYQFGFRKDRSTELAILEISHILKTSIDNNLITCGVFLAFDTVNHEILLTKEISLRNFLMLCNLIPSFSGTFK